MFLAAKANPIMVGAASAVAFSVAYTSDYGVVLREEKEPCDCQTYWTVLIHASDEGREVILTALMILAGPDADCDPDDWYCHGPWELQAFHVRGSLCEPPTQIELGD